MRAALAGIIYALIVFAAGIVVTLIRVGFLQPLTGATVALLLELPVVIALSWFVSQELINFLNVRSDIVARLVMGLIGFILLMLYEFLLMNVLFQNSLATFIASLVAWPGILGFLGEVAFGLIPALQHAARRKPV